MVAARFPAVMMEEGGHIEMDCLVVRISAIGEILIEILILILINE